MMNINSFFLNLIYFDQLASEIRNRHERKYLKPPVSM